MEEEQQNLLSEDQTILSELRETLSDMQGNFSIEYIRQRESLMFESGVQWEPSEVRKRRDRPSLTSNMVKPYVNRIVNPYILSPVSVTIEDDEDVPETKVMKALIDDIEKQSDAGESYQTAFRNAVTCGRGFIHVGTQYRNDESMDLTIGVDTVRDPLTCYLNSASEEIDGRDATRGVYVKYISKETAEAEYGEGVNSTSIDVYNGWPVPENTVPSLLFYIKRSQKITRQFLADGRYVDSEQPVEGAVRARPIDSSVVDCYQIVGSVVVSKTTLQTPYIPIIPVYGFRMYTEQGIEYGGVVDQVHDTQTLINYYNSSEAELVSDSPKSPWMATEGQIEGYEKIWKVANREKVDVLVYKPESLGDKLVPPPQRTNTMAQTQGIVASKQGQIADLGRETSIHDTQMGAQTSAQEAGNAILARNKQGEIATADYADNLHKSINQVGRVLLYMIKSLYDTPRMVTVDGQKIQVTPSQLNISINELSLSVMTGPTIESRKQESIKSLELLAQLNPGATPLIAIRIAENLDVPNKRDIIKDLKKVLPPELKDPEPGQQNAPDPQAVQALQEAEQTIKEMEDQQTYLMRVIEQLQNAIQDNSADRDAKLAEAELKANTTLAEAEIRQNTEITKAHIQADSKMGVEDTKQDNENLRTTAEIYSDYKKQRTQLEHKVMEKGLDVAKEVVKKQTHASNVDQLEIAPMTPGPVSIDSESN